MSNTAPSRADPVVVFHLSRWCPPQETSQPHPPHTVSQATQNILSKFVYCRNGTSYGNFKLKLCVWAQSMALGSRTKFQLEILTILSKCVFRYCFTRLFWRARETLVKQPPGWSLSDCFEVVKFHISNIFQNVDVFLIIIMYFIPFFHLNWNDLN